MALLCLSCRQSGHRTAGCPFEPDKGQTPSAASIATTLGHGPDLCQIFQELRLIPLLLSGDVRDELTGEQEEGKDENEMTGAGRGGDAVGSINRRHNIQHFRNLGPFRDIVFLDSCPLCRLIFSIFPAYDKSIATDTEYLLRPMRTYNRLGKGRTLTDVDESIKKKYSISISVGTKEHFTTANSQHMGEPQEASLQLFVKSFALSSNNEATRDQGLPARVMDVSFNPELAKAWLHRCETEHHDCHATWSDELLTTRMIDVESRAVINCPSHCKYTALSYVWGSVIPEDGALGKGTLPPTIEDAISVTKNLGIRYLWVDTLCIDQRPSPQKLQQLSIMDLIYNGAYATLMALHGDDSSAGLRGVQPRETQSCEWVDGYELATMFPPLAVEIQAATCKHSTRAWTLQELILSRRRIFFGKDQVHYTCGWMDCEESIDEGIDPARIMERPMGNDAVAEFENVLKLQRVSALESPSSELRRRATDKYYTFLVGIYSMRSMTNDSYSLNACLGLLNYLHKHLVPGGFIWGMPLKDYPQSLRWYHMRWVKPRRRNDFPSWSFVGWEGEADYTDGLILKGGAPTGIKRFSEDVDMGVSFVKVEGKALTLKGFVVRLEIRNEPFNDAYVPGTDSLIGMLQEGAVLHKITLPAGVFEFVIVERLKYRNSEEGKMRHTLYLLMLGDPEDGIPTRRSMVRLFVDPDFIESEEYVKVIQKLDNINLV